MTRPMFYKIKIGYSEEDYIRIDHTELEKAHYCFLMKKDSIYSGGAVKGSQILSITPDFHRYMGWNQGYELGVLDFEELRQKGIDEKHHNFLALTKEKIQYLVDTKQEHLIGKNVPIDGFIQKPKEAPRGLTSIGEVIKNK